MNYNKKFKYFNSNIIMALFIPLIIIGKFVRYTLLKTVLVDTGIGHIFLPLILSGDNHFAFGNMESVANNNAIAIFSMFNILGLNTYIEFEIVITIIFNIILFFLIFSQKKRLDIYQTIFLIFSILVLNIFDFALAKEPIQMLYFLAIYFILINKNMSNKNKFIFSMIILLFSAITYRVYYLIIVFYSTVIFTLFKLFLKNKKKIKLKHIVLMLLVLVLIYFVILNILKIISLENFQEIIRVRTRVSSAKTDMRNILSGASSNLMIFCFDYLIMIVRMLFPLELILFGPKYWFYVLYQIIISIYVIYAIRRYKQNNEIKNISLIIYMGFLFGSACFEPDFGSWVRHEAVIFPLFLFISDIVTIKNNKEILVKE